MIIVASAGVELVPTLSTNFRRDVEQHGRRAGEQFGNSFNRGANAGTRNTLGSRFGRQAQTDAGRHGSKAGKTFGQRFKASATKIGLGLGTALAGGIGAFAALSIKSLARIERINTQTETAIKSTGRAARVSAKHVEDLAGALENMTATEAESIQQGANFLLTFTKIRNGVGKSNKIFDRTVMAMTDMSRAMDNTGGVILDTRTQALQLGKALNDPVKGVTALQRVGVSFTQDQRDQIKTLVESGKTMKAQKLILRELEKEFGGSGKAFAKTATGRIELAKHALGTFGEAIMEEALPALGRLADKGTKALNTLTEHAPEIREFGHDVIDLGKTLGQELLPHLKTVGKAVVGTVKFFAELPEPVKKFGAQALIAAVVLPKLAAGLLAVRSAGLAASASVLTFGQRIAQNRAAMSYQNTLMGKAREAMVGFGGAARQAAGIGGMVLLAQGMQQTDKTARTLMLTLGGAGLGATFGPLGAAIGGAAGLLAGLATGTDKAKNAMTPAIKAAGDYATTLDELTGASTRATRAEAARALQSQDAFTLARALKISSEDLVGATLGQEVAVRRVEAALKGNNATTSTWVDAMGKVHTGIPIMTEDALKLSRILGVESASIRDNSQKTRDLALASGKLRAELGGVQRVAKNKIIARLETQGWPEAEADMRRLLRNIKLTPPQVKTVIKALGVGPAIKDVDKFADAIANQTPKKAKEGGQRTGKALNEGTKQGVKTGKSAWENLYKTSLANGGGAKPSASSGGRSIGQNLAVSTALGILGGIPSVTAAAITMARAAEAAAKNELDIHSPSRKFVGIGKNVVLGLARGINLNTGVVGKSITRMLALINTAAKKHDISKTLAQQYRKLVNGIAAQATKLRNLISARNDLAKSITDNLRGEFDLTTITAKNEFGISQGPREAVKAAQALVARMKGFAQKLVKLRKAGLPGSLIQEIAGYGSLEGTRVADVLLGASKERMGSLKTSYAQVQKLANQAGLTAANATYGAKIEFQSEKLEDALERGLAKMGIRVDLNVDRRTSARIYKDGKAAAGARR